MGRAGWGGRGCLPPTGGGHAGLALMSCRCCRPPQVMDPPTRQLVYHINQLKRPIELDTQEQEVGGVEPCVLWQAAASCPS